MQLATSKKAIDAVKEIALKETEMARGLNILDEKNHDQAEKDNVKIPSIWWMIADCTDKIMSNDELKVQEGWLALGGLRSSLVETFHMIDQKDTFLQFDILLEIFRRHWMEINSVKLN